MNTPAFHAAVAAREKRAAESHAEAVERIALEQRERAYLLDARNDPGGASKVAARESDLHVLMGQLTAPSVSIQEVNVTFSFDTSRKPRLLESHVVPDGELQGPVAGLEVDAGADGPAEIVVVPAAPETPEEQLHRFIRENGAREAAEYAARQAEPGSAYIAPDPRRRGGF